MPTPAAVTDPKEKAKEKAQIELLKKRFISAYFSLFSVPNPNAPNVPVPFEFPFPISILQSIPVIGDLMAQFFLAGVDVKEGPKRFSTGYPTDVQHDLVTYNDLGEQVATVAIHWRTIPWDFVANPVQDAPPTILNPFGSHRFEMLEGQFRFLDQDPQSGFDGFGSGRTFSTFPEGTALNIGAVITILHGVGKLPKKLIGMIIVNGQITPPKELSLNLMVRLYDKELIAKNKT